MAEPNIPVEGFCFSALLSFQVLGKPEPTDVSGRDNDRIPRRVRAGEVVLDAYKAMDVFIKDSLKDNRWAISDLAFFSSTGGCPRLARTSLKCFLRS